MKIRKILINTNHVGAGPDVYVKDLTIRFANAGFEVYRNDWKYTKDYNLIIFSAPDSDVTTAKEKLPNAIIGIFDPKVKNSKQKNEVVNSDFICVSSIEQREYFLKFNKNIFIYYMFRDIIEKKKIHSERRKILIGYHGNKIHLEMLKPDINTALDKLSEKYEVELVAMYNIGSLGKWKKNLPIKINVKHIQWSEVNYNNELSKCDIGIVPNLVPINSKLVSILTGYKARLTNQLGYENADYITRYKYSTNPGRIYIFAKLGIPVISDFVPSACQFIEDGVSGVLVNGSKGWYNAMELLINDFRLRQSMSDELKRKFKNRYAPENIFKEFLKYIYEFNK